MAELGFATEKREAAWINSTNDGSWMTKRARLDCSGYEFGDACPASRGWVLRSTRPAVGSAIRDGDVVCGDGGAHGGRWYGVVIATARALLDWARGGAELGEHGVVGIGGEVELWIG
ncbi:hypothetical protein M0R45_021561 [Rubus argutus]|uniref:Uncharacterized protein n=1 Tax=Rubus argutus TaxID=59490 RepID=A0AAW1XC45_RUBAR